MRPSGRKWNALLASISQETGQLRPFNGPTHVFLEVTTRCNLSCVMCGRTHDRRFKGKSRVGDMSLDTVKKLDRIYGRSRFVTATGLGEPFLNPDFMAILRHLKKKGALVSLTTNGTLLNEHLARALVEEDIDRVVFSIDSPDPDTFRRIRPGADLDQITRNIATLVEFRAKSSRKSPYLILESVAMASNFHQLPRLADLAHRLDFDEVIVQSLFKHFDPGYDSFYRKNALAVLDPQEASLHWEEFRRRLNRYSVSLYSPLQTNGIQSYLTRQGHEREPASGAGSSPLGYIDQPAPLEHLSGSCRVSGWVLAKDGVPQTEIAWESTTDSLYIPVQFHVERPDVLSSLPAAFPRESRCGFDCQVDLSALGPGIYTLFLRVHPSQERPPQVVARQQVLVSFRDAYRRYCTQPWSTVYVAYNGEVRTCCFSEYPLGDLLQASLSEIWRGMPFAELRNDVWQGTVRRECADCLAGRSLPIDGSSSRALLAKR